MTTESLIRAVESRLDHKPQTIQEALQKGYILAPYFAEALPKYEKQEAAMVVYYPIMIGAIDLMREDTRLTQVQFNKPPDQPAAPVEPPAPPPLTGVAKTLDDAEKLMTAYGKQPDPAALVEARKLFQEAAQQAVEKPKLAAANYGLARIALAVKDFDNAETLFHTTLDLDPEPFVRAWALVYLGKLSLAAAENDQAVRYFQNALQVKGASDKAREEASKGVVQGSKK